MNSFEEAIAYLLRVAGITIVQLFALGGPALLLVALLSWLSGLVQVMAYAAFGRSAFLWIFGWLGTSLHEIAHALTALLFGHQIKSFRPFAPDGRGTLGSVGTAYRTSSLYQHIGLFFIGIAPVLFGAMLIYLALNALFREQVQDIWWNMTIQHFDTRSPIAQVASSGLAFMQAIFSPRNFLSWRLYLFLYIAFSIGSSIRLSQADINAATPGCLTFVALLFMFNTVLLSLGVANGDTFAWLTQYYTFFYIILCFAILLDLLAIAILWLPAAIGRSAARH